MSFIKPPCTEGSGTAVSQQRNVDAFNSIALDVEATVTVAQGQSQSLEVTAQENLLPIITTSVSDEVLTIAETECFSTTVGVTAHATISAWKGITVASSGQVNGSGISFSTADITVTASGGVNLQDISAGTANVRLSSSGNIQLAGSATTLNVNLSASGDVTADECESETCTVTVSGSGDVRVYVTGNLNATISGSGNIYYRGNPTIEQHITGSGKLIPIE